MERRQRLRYRFVVEFNRIPEYACLRERNSYDTPTRDSALGSNIKAVEASSVPRGAIEVTAPPFCGGGEGKGELALCVGIKLLNYPRARDSALTFDLGVLQAHPHTVGSKREHSSTISRWRRGIKCHLPCMWERSLK